MEQRSTGDPAAGGDDKDSHPENAWSQREPLVHCVNMMRPERAARVFKKGRSV
jgi:hypothetical protein